MEGFYAMYYTGISGFGHAVFVLKDGIISGADVTGGVLDGHYKTNDEGKIEIDVVLTVPAGTTLVTGQAVSAPFSQNIQAGLNENFTNGEPVPVQTPMGPVNVVFKKLRALQ